MSESETVGQRFSQLITHLGITKNAFAASIGKTATVIQHLVDERNKPGFDLLGVVFSTYPNVSRDWLMLGVGPMMLADSPVSNAPARVARAKVSASALELSEATAVDAPAGPAPVPMSQAAATTSAASSPDAPEPPSKTATPEAAAPVPSPAANTLVTAAAPVAPAEAAPAPAAPLVAVAPAEAAWQATLYTQQMAHQLAMAELRNQHLQEQQRLMQQMLDLMQRQLSPR